MIFIGVGLVALLAAVAGVGVMCYKKYGTLFSMTAEHEENIMEFLSCFIPETVRSGLHKRK